MSTNGIANANDSSHRFKSLRKVAVSGTRSDASSPIMRDNYNRTVAGSGKDPEPEFASRKPNPASAEVEELKLELEDMQRVNESLQRRMQEGRGDWEAEQESLTSQIEQLHETVRQLSEGQDQTAGENRNAWEAERRRMSAQIKELEQQLQQTSGKPAQVSNEVIAQLRRQYEQRLQETLSKNPTRR